MSVEHDKRMSAEEEGLAKKDARLDAGAVESAATELLDGDQPPPAVEVERTDDLLVKDSVAQGKVADDVRGLSQRLAFWNLGADEASRELERSLEARLAGLWKGGKHGRAGLEEARKMPTVLPKEVMGSFGCGTEQDGQDLGVMERRGAGPKEAILG